MLTNAFFKDVPCGQRFIHNDIPYRKNNSSGWAKNLANLTTKQFDDLEVVSNLGSHGELIKNISWLLLGEHWNYIDLLRGLNINDFLSVAMILAELHKLVKLPNSDDTNTYPIVQVFALVVSQYPNEYWSI